MSLPAASLVFYATAALLGACILVLLVLLLVAMRRTGSLRTRRAASAEVRPALQAALVEFLAGGTDDSLLRRNIRTHPADIAASILLFQTTVGGSARDRLCALALDLGLVRQWCAQSASRVVVHRRGAFANLAFTFAYEPCRRVAGDLLVESLNDADEEVRLSACRGLVLAGGEAEIEDLFELAIRPNLLTRIVLTEDLRNYALTLAAGPVREVLRSGDATRVRATMQILVAWERAIPLEDLREFLDSRDREIRVWDAATGKDQKALKGPNDDVLGLAFSPDGKTLAAVAGHHCHWPAEDDRSHTRTGALPAAGRPGTGAPCRRCPGGHAARGPANPRRTQREPQPGRRAGRPRSLGASQDGRLVEALSVAACFTLAMLVAALAIFAATGFSALLKGCFELRRTLRAASQSFDSMLLKSPIVPGVSVILAPRDASPESRALVRRLLDLTFGRHELVLVLDGPSEPELDRWVLEFHLYPQERVVPESLPTAAIRGCYLSRDPIRLLVVDKQPGGTADALNAGVNAAQYPVIGLVDPDADFIPELLLRLIRPMLADWEGTVAVCGVAPPPPAPGLAGCIGAIEALRLWLVRLADFAPVRWNSFWTCTPPLAPRPRPCGSPSSPRRSVRAPPPAPGAICAARCCAISDKWRQPCGEPAPAAAANSSACSASARCARYWKLPPISWPPPVGSPGWCPWPWRRWCW